MLYYKSQEILINEGMIKMALDGIFLYSILEELKGKILLGRVDKVNQPETDEIVLNIRGTDSNYKLSVSASAVYPKIHFTDINKTNPLTAPMFCMVLRKYLTGARIADIRQLETDRVVIIDFESTDEMGFYSIYSLIIEIMGRHSNISLVRSRDQIIMESIKHVTPDINTYRCLYPGIKFVYPPPSDRLNPFNTDFDEFKDFTENKQVQFDDYFSSKVFTGVSTALSKEISYRLKSSEIEMKAHNLYNIYCFIKSIFNALKERSFYFATYTLGDSIKDFHCIKFTNLVNHEIKEFSSPSKLIIEYYSIKDKYDRLNSKSLDLQKLINTNMDRCIKKISILNAAIEESKDKDYYKINGELLTANIYALKKGDESAEVMNYYDENNAFINIKLDENKTPSENIQAYFKKYNKLKKSEENAITQLKNATDELAYLQSVFTSIKNVENYEEIEEIKAELIETQYIKFKKGTKNKKLKLSKPIHIVSSDGIDIYIGKNNIQNDTLTLKFADKHDLWLHTKNIPGSHVIIKKFGEIPDSTLLEAAQAAAFYSKAKDSSKVPVDYTEVRNVKKPSGSKPGMVIYYTNKTIYVDPKKPDLKQKLNKI